MSTPAARGPLEGLRTGGKRAMALALARIEAAPGEPQTLALLDAAYAGAKAHVVGITGPPGVGKSSLISSLIQAHRRQGQTIGVIAVDPSSARSGGALLGDRARLEVDPEDQGVYFRSMASRGRLGGLAALTPAAVVLMRATYDVVVVETVGVGQAETEVATVADSIVFCVQPGSGDSLQYLKAGIAEIPDILAVTKADLGAPAHKAANDVRAALEPQAPRTPGWSVPVTLVSNLDDHGIDTLLAALADHRAALDRDGLLEVQRAAQAEAWLRTALREEFGRFGLARLERQTGALALASGQSPFRRMRDLARVVERETAAAEPWARS